MSLAWLGLEIEGDWVVGWLCWLGFLGGRDATLRYCTAYDMRMDGWMDIYVGYGYGYEDL